MLRRDDTQKARDFSSFFCSMMEKELEATRACLEWEKLNAAEEMELKRQKLYDKRVAAAIALAHDNKS